MKTITLTTDIPPNRVVQLQLPSDTPTGPVDLVVVLAPHTPSAIHTLGDLLHSDFFGMWRERDDIDDSIEFAQHLRDTAWRRTE